MQETYMYCDIRYETQLNTILYGWKVFYSVVSTLIQYLFDGDTLIVRIQCCVLEVLQRIIYNLSPIKFKSQNTDS